MIDSTLACPNCSCELWEIHKRTGTGELPQEQIKLKCSGCGQWFICNRKQVTKLLGQ